MKSYSFSKDSIYTNNVKYERYNNIKLQEPFQNIISNKIYYSSSIFNNKIENKKELADIFLKDDLKNDFILTNKFTYFNENLLVSSENLYKIITYFETIEEDKLNSNTFNIIFSFYLSQQNSVVLN